MGESEIVLAPTKDNKVSGVITISLVNAPAETKQVGFDIVKSEVNWWETNEAEQDFDKDDSDGWSIEVDTTTYANKEYAFLAIAYTNKIVPGEMPLAISVVKAVIDN